MQSSCKYVFLIFRSKEKKGDPKWGEIQAVKDSDYFYIVVEFTVRILNHHLYEAQLITLLITNQRRVPRESLNLNKDNKGKEPAETVVFEHVKKTNPLIFEHY